MSSVVLHVLSIGNNVISVSFVWNTLIIDLDEFIGCSWLLLQLISLLHFFLVFFALFLLDLLDFFDFVFKLSISSLLDQLAISLIWLTLLTLSQFKWVASFWDILRIIIVVEINLNIL